MSNSNPFFNPNLGGDMTNASSDNDSVVPYDYNNIYDIIEAFNNHITAGDVLEENIYDYINNNNIDLIRRSITIPKKRTKGENIRSKQIRYDNVIERLNEPLEQLQQPVSNTIRKNNSSSSFDNMLPKPILKSPERTNNISSERKNNSPGVSFSKKYASPPPKTNVSSSDTISPLSTTSKNITTAAGDPTYQQLLAWYHYNKGEGGPPEFGGNVIINENSGDSQNTPGGVSALTEATGLNSQLSNAASENTYRPDQHKQNNLYGTVLTGNPELGVLDTIEERSDEGSTSSKEKESLDRISNNPGSYFPYDDGDGDKSSEEKDNDIKIYKEASEKIANDVNDVLLNSEINNVHGNSNEITENIEKFINESLDNISQPQNPTNDGNDGDDQSRSISENRSALVSIRDDATTTARNIVDNVASVPEFRNLNKKSADKVKEILADAYNAKYNFEKLARLAINKMDNQTLQDKPFEELLEDENYRAMLLKAMTVASRDVINNTLKGQPAQFNLAYQSGVQEKVKKKPYRCYICGCDLITGTVSAEMEHVLPGSEFYYKYGVEIKDDPLVKKSWKNDYKASVDVYNDVHFPSDFSDINLDVFEEAKKTNDSFSNNAWGLKIIPEDMRIGILDEAIKESGISTNHGEYSYQDDNNRNEKFPHNEILEVQRRAYITEFAYSHMLCNRVKGDASFKEAAKDLEKNGIPNNIKNNLIIHYADDLANYIYRVGRKEKGKIVDRYYTAENQKITFPNKSGFTGEEGHDEAKEIVECYERDGKDGKDGLYRYIANSMMYHCKLLDIIRQEGTQEKLKYMPYFLNTKSVLRYTPSSEHINHCNDLVKHFSNKDTILEEFAKYKSNRLCVLKQTSRFTDYSVESLPEDEDHFFNDCRRHGEILDTSIDNYNKLANVINRNNEEKLNYNISYATSFVPTINDYENGFDDYLKAKMDSNSSSGTGTSSSGAVQVQNQDPCVHMLNYLESWKKNSINNSQSLVETMHSSNLPEPNSRISDLINNRYQSFRGLKANNNYQLLLKRINNSLVYPVPSDGNCLYSSFSLIRALEQSPLQNNELTYNALIDRMGPFDIRTRICQSDNDGGHKNRATLEYTDNYNTIQKSLLDPNSGNWGEGEDLGHILDNEETVVFINVSEQNTGEMRIVTNQGSYILLNTDSAVTRETNKQIVSENLQEGRRVHIILSYGLHFAPLINNTEENHDSIQNNKPMIALTYNNNVGGKKKKTKRKKRKVAKKKTINKRKK